MPRELAHVHAAGLASRPPEPADPPLEKETPSPGPDASPNVVLLDIPHEIIERLLWLLVEPAANPQQGSAYINLARASSTCRALLQCAASAWRELTMAMLGGRPWIGPPPPRWSACVQNCMQPLAGLSLLTHGDGTAATGRRQRLGLPRKCFAHSVVQWGDALYLWGGRDDATYSNQLHVLPLRMALDTTRGGGGSGGGGARVRGRVPYRDDRRHPYRGTGDATGDAAGGGGDGGSGGGWGGWGGGGSCWETPQPSGSLPKPRRAHTATVAGDMMHVLGGGTVLDAQTYGDHHALDLRTLHWSAQPAPPDWHAFGHTCVLAPASQPAAVIAAKAKAASAAATRATQALAQAAEAAEAVTAEAVWGTPSMILAATAEAATAAAAAAEAAVAAADASVAEGGAEAEDATGDSLMVFGGAWNPASRGGMGVTARLLAYHLGTRRWREVSAVGGGARGALPPRRERGEKPGGAEHGGVGRVRARAARAGGGGREWCGQPLQRRAPCAALPGLARVEPAALRGGAALAPRRPCHVRGGPLPLHLRRRRPALRPRGPAAGARSRRDDGARHDELALGRGAAACRVPASQAAGRSEPQPAAVRGRPLPAAAGRPRVRPASAPRELACRQAPGPRRRPPHPDR